MEWNGPFLVALDKLREFRQKFAVGGGCVSCCAMQSCISWRRRVPPSPSPSLRSEFSLKFSATATQQPPPPSLSPQPWCEPNRIDPRPSPPCHRIGGAICSRMLASGKGKMKVNMVFHVAINFSSVGCKWDVSYFICPNAIQLLIATQVPTL